MADFSIFLDQMIRNLQMAAVEEKMPDSEPKKTRIQQRREKLVLDCALEVFATYGFYGATIDQIATKADLSKPNVLYYFKNKDEIYQALLQRTLIGWADTFLAIKAEDDPMETLERYVSAKLDFSFDNPLPSRLFANEVISGLPHTRESLQTVVRGILDEKAAILQGWMDKGKLRQVDPYHLIFSMWSVTQHYADFASQIECLLGQPPNRAQTKQAVIEILLRGLKIS